MNAASCNDASISVKSRSKFIQTVHCAKRLYTNKNTQKRQLQYTATNDAMNSFHLRSSCGLQSAESVITNTVEWLQSAFKVC